MANPKWNNYIFDNVDKIDMIDAVVDVMWVVSDERLASILEFVFGQPFTVESQNVFTSIDQKA